MNDETASDPAARRAKVVLWLAVGVFVIAQVIGTDHNGRMPVWVIKEWPGIGLGIWFDFGRHVDDVQLLRKLAVAISTVAVLIGAPWFVGLLIRVRPVLWCLRLLMTALCVVWLRTETSLSNFWFTTDFAEMRLEFHLLKELLSAEPGFWTYMAALLMNVIGLWLIPRSARGEA